MPVLGQKMPGSESAVSGPKQLDRFVTSWRLWIKKRIKQPILLCASCEMRTPEWYCGMCNLRYCDECDRLVHPSTFEQIVVKEEEEDEEFEDAINKNASGGTARTIVKTIEVPSSHRRERSKLTCNLNTLPGYRLLKLDLILPRIQALSSIPDLLQKECFGLPQDGHRDSDDVKVCVDDLTAEDELEKASKPRQRWSNSKPPSPVHILEDSLDEEYANRYIKDENQTEIRIREIEHTPVFCDYHPTSLIQYYCIDCETRLCNKCIRDEPHNDKSVTMGSSASDSLTRLLSDETYASTSKVKERYVHSERKSHLVVPIEAVFWLRLAMLWLLIQSELKPRLTVNLALSSWCQSVLKNSSFQEPTEQTNSTSDRALMVGSTLQSNSVLLMNIEARFSALFTSILQFRGESDFLSNWQRGISTFIEDEIPSINQGITQPPPLPRIWQKIDDLPACLNVYPWVVSRSSSVESSSAHKPVRSSSPIGISLCLDASEMYLEIALTCIDALNQASSLPFNPRKLVFSPPRELIHEAKAEIDWEQIASKIAEQTLVKVQSELSNSISTALEASQGMQELLDIVRKAKDSKGAMAPTPSIESHSLELPLSDSKEQTELGAKAIKDQSVVVEQVEEKKSKANEDHETLPPDQSSHDSQADITANDSQSQFVLPLEENFATQNISSQNKYSKEDDTKKLSSIPATHKDKQSPGDLLTLKDVVKITDSANEVHQSLLDDPITPLSAMTPSPSAAVTTTTSSSTTATATTAIDPATSIDSLTTASVMSDATDLAEDKVILGDVTDLQNPSTGVKARPKSLSRRAKSKKNPSLERQMKATSEKIEIPKEFRIEPISKQNEAVQKHLQVDEEAVIRAVGTALQGIHDVTRTEIGHWQGLAQRLLKVSTLLHRKVSVKSLPHEEISLPSVRHSVSTPASQPGVVYNEARPETSTHNFALPNLLNLGLKSSQGQSNMISNQKQEPTQTPLPPELSSLAQRIAESVKSRAR